MSNTKKKPVYAAGSAKLMTKGDIDKLKQAATRKEAHKWATGIHESQNQVHALLAQVRDMEHQATGYRSHIMDLEKIIEVFKQTVDQLHDSNTELEQYANVRTKDASVIADQPQQRLNLELSAEHSYLDLNWESPASWWKGFDLYLFGSWVTLRKTSHGWKFKSGARPVK